MSWRAGLLLASALLAAASVLPASAQGTSAADDFVHFVTPDREIECDMAPYFGPAMGSGYVRCGINRNRFRPTSGYFSGHEDQSRRWRVDGNGERATSGMSGRIFGISPSSVSSVPLTVLRNGQTVGAGVFRCTYRSAAVTCRNTRSGHGFTISRKAQRTF
jgi:hypothetical protein